jgi:hypothetical protein
MIEPYKYYSAIIFQLQAFIEKNYINENKPGGADEAAGAGSAAGSATAATPPAATATPAVTVAAAQAPEPHATPAFRSEQFGAELIKRLTPYGRRVEAVSAEPFRHRFQINRFTLLPSSVYRGDFSI